eukprot:CAMPEP_0202955354 /NCGR_PEP_ID=MMETSP1395-20130829/51741_1 /ASSEMBLY_ACC=CAM_ASM_000871 /TAXON_ID=5961 /ORGANISM="Blepharisma japonicum, Strain Stock R1072" /LENGTH=69 /DNA_ID=CAMNT_0049671823 /DNA_START=1020 /DNA_END=1229 /DNA_ORIENTATION=+
MSASLKDKFDVFRESMSIPLTRTGNSIEGTKFLIEFDRFARRKTGEFDEDEADTGDSSAAALSEWPSSE